MSTSSSAQLGGGGARCLPSCLLLTAAVLAVWPLFACVGYSDHGILGVWAAVTSAVVCGVSALLALVLAAVFQGSLLATYGLLLGVLARTGLPLALGIVLDTQQGPLAKAGVFGMIVVYYLWTLAVETVLSVRMIQPTLRLPR